MIKHFTASAYIAARIDGEIRILLHQHKKLDIWVGIGGHIEINENPLDATLREVEEETNLEVSILSAAKKSILKESEISEIPLPIMISEQLIPTRGDESQHIHIDHMYAAFTKNPEGIRMSENYRWFSKSDIQTMKGKTATQIRIISERVFELVKNL